MSNDWILVDLFISIRLTTGVGRATNENHEHKQTCFRRKYTKLLANMKRRLLRLSVSRSLSQSEITATRCLLALDAFGTCSHNSAITCTCPPDRFSVVSTMLGISYFELLFVLGLGSVILGTFSKTIS